MELSPNPGKNLIIEIAGEKYARYPVRTHIITPNDNMAEVVLKYAKPYLQPGDVIFLSERTVAISQGRTFEKDKVKVGKLARLLVRFVTKSPYGIGLGSPQTMQLAVEEVGSFRMLLAAFFAALAKPLGVKGAFYKVAGPQAKAVDGAADYVIPPYNKHVTKAPLKPHQTAQQISDKAGVPVALVDACDVGAWIIGRSKGVPETILLAALKDNPLGQTKQQTPIGILRKVK